MILLDVKAVLGLPPETVDFDQELLIHINSAAATLRDIGVGPSDGVEISENTDWDIFLETPLIVNQVKTFVGFSVKKLFDPPQNSKYMDVISGHLDELIWRLRFRKEEDD